MRKERVMKQEEPDLPTDSQDVPKKNPTDEKELKVTGKKGKWLSCFALLLVVGA